MIKIARYFIRMIQKKNRKEQQNIVEEVENEPKKVLKNETKNKKVKKE